MAPRRPFWYIFCVHFEGVHLLRFRVLQRGLSAVLAALFVLASILPPLSGLLPRDPLALAASRPEAGPTIWFPLAYALSGLPAAPGRPAPNPLLQLELRQSRRCCLPVLTTSGRPAVLVQVALALGPLACSFLLPHPPDSRPHRAELSPPDPPPRSPANLALPF